LNPNPTPMMGPMCRNYVGRAGRRVPGAHVRQTPSFCLLGHTERVSGHQGYTVHCRVRRALNLEYSVFYLRERVSDPICCSHLFDGDTPCPKARLHPSRPRFPIAHPQPPPSHEFPCHNFPGLQCRTRAPQVAVRHAWTLPRFFFEICCPCGSSGHSQRSYPGKEGRI